MPTQIFVNRPVKDVARSRADGHGIEDLDVPLWALASMAPGALPPAQP